MQKKYATKRQGGLFLQFEYLLQKKLVAENLNLNNSINTMTFQNSDDDYYYMLVNNVNQRADTYVFLTY